MPRPGLVGSSIRPLRALKHSASLAAWHASRVGELAYSRIRKLGITAAAWTDAAVPAAHQGHIGAARLPHTRVSLGRVVDEPPLVDAALSLAGVAGAGLERPPALFHELAGLVGVAGVGVARDVVAYGAAEQLIDRL